MSTPASLRLLRLIVGGWPYLAPAAPLLGLQLLGPGRHTVAYNGAEQPLHSLAALLGLVPTTERHAVLVASATSGCVAFAVQAAEALTEQQAAEVQPLPPLLQTRRNQGWVLGLFVTDGEPLLVIDLAAIAAERKG